MTRATDKPNRKPPPRVDQRAEATKAVAKTASKAIDSANAVGRFLHRVFGNIIEDSVGLASDPLRAFRLRRLADLQIKTDQYLASKGVTATEVISPRIAYPLVQQASLEDDEDLHSRFARLLAEALDPNGEKITRRHADVMTSLTSENFVALDYCWKYRHQIGHVYYGSKEVRYESTPTGGLAVRSLVELQTAIQATEDGLRNLVSLGLIKSYGEEVNVLPPTYSSFGQVGGNVRFRPITVYGDVYEFELTEFGISFCRAMVEPTARGV